MSGKDIQAEVNIGLIGHVDHGKTSLTKALTGNWADTHSEELKRGISIRLGYADTAFYENQGPGMKFFPEYLIKNRNYKGKLLRRISFVDAPGHETLMTTMLSGAALMNGAVLVIAANEKCPQPRTIEHLTALKAAGITNIVVAQNKIDLVSKEKAIENYKDIKNFLVKQGFDNVPIIPVAANHLSNLDLLIDAIEKNIPSPKTNQKDKLKMFIARSFDINKPGTHIKDLKGAVVGGTIVSGSVSVGDDIELKPGFDNKVIITKVISLATSFGSLNTAKRGGLIAIGTALDPSLAQNDQLRGQVVGKKGELPDETLSLKLSVEVFDRYIENLDSNISVGDILVLTIGTNTNVGVVSKSVKNIVELNLKNPCIVEKGDKIAISKKNGNLWRMIAFGTVE